ncbi:DUF456 domain-containing protein [Micrococcus sp.]|uniref:DUF456 domain-containing protein n=1 Tax=Micrococcus sp. TaxID=1271 RepID=UPI002A914A8C|nr:DUF456 domain-containing protein [Micrococcus sp.]MDY6054746.1 DUF456 domain-containing protein [Micrococcus sp.]
MSLAVIVSVLAVLLLLVGMVGIIYPILPGSILNAVTALVWAAVLGSAASWTFGVVAAGLSIAGMSASAVLTGRRLRRERIPRGPILVGIAAAAVGFFVVPFVGVFLGFALGLLGAEWVRRRDLAAAWSASWGALKAMGLGILVELVCAMAALAVLGAGIVAHFQR